MLLPVCLIVASIGSAHMARAKCNACWRRWLWLPLTPKKSAQGREVFGQGPAKGLHTLAKARSGRARIHGGKGVVQHIPADGRYLARRAVCAAPLFDRIGSAKGDDLGCHLATIVCERIVSKKLAPRLITHNVREFGRIAGLSIEDWYVA